MGEGIGSAAMGHPAASVAWLVNKLSEFDVSLQPGDVVLTPFMGVGSEAYVAIEEGRKAIGIELKDSYYREAVKNLNLAVDSRRQKSLF